MNRRDRRPLHAQLFLDFAVLSLIITATISGLFMVVTSVRTGAALRDKSTQYARLLQSQLEPVVAFDDSLTAREIFASFTSDADVKGLGVYNAQGNPIRTLGATPARLVAGTAPTLRGECIVIAGITSREGARGFVYVSLSTRVVWRTTTQFTAMAVGIAALVLALAMVLARRVARRMATIVAPVVRIAERIAQGDFRPASLPKDTNDELSALSTAFNRMAFEIDRLFDESQRRAASEHTRLEALVTERTAELESSREMFRQIVEQTHAIPFVLDLEAGAFDYVGPQATQRFGFAEGEWSKMQFLDRLLPPAFADDVRKKLAECEGDVDVESIVETADGQRRNVRWVCSSKQGDKRRLQGLLLDITEQRRLEHELQQAQKLESVGRLAAGVAHEINTPLQFISDSLEFVKHGWGGLEQFVAAYQRFRAEVGEALGDTLITKQVDEAENASDLTYLMKETPLALGRASEGLSRVTKIVQAMKKFSHPDQQQKALVDLNAAIESTLTIARPEYKYYADLDCDFGAIPRVFCHGGEINQVVLNLVVNAAHAIAEKVGDSGSRGVIRVRTRTVETKAGEQVEIAIGDTGMGIPVAIQPKIFDLFFTTKPVGKGTGQGLALARSVIAKHGGTLSFESQVGVGTTFYLRLPIEGAPAMVSKAS